ncbi:hypothetical protein ACHAWF_015318 [Thalassiosira exigua]
MSFEEEFQSAILKKLRDDGICNEVTAAVRSRVLQTVLKDEGNESSPIAFGPQETALLSLVYHFFEQKGLLHTLCVLTAECRLENPLPSQSSFEALGLDARDVEENAGLFALLQAASTSKAVQTETKAVQTETREVPDKENAMDGRRRDEPGAIKSIDQRLIEIESECQQRMRTEMNEKLRLSAKKAAAVATRRLRQQHKESVLALRAELEAEREQAQRRQEELEENLSQQKLRAQKESAESEKLVRAVLLEKESLQSEMDQLNDRVKRMQQERFEEWTEEHGKLAEQKRSLQTQLHEVAVEKDRIRATELKVETLEQDRENLLSEMSGQHCQQSKSLVLLKEKYHAAKVDLDASRKEVRGLRTLLKQSQVAFSSLSFREVGMQGGLKSGLRSIYRPSLEDTLTHRTQTNKENVHTSSHSQSESRPQASDSPRASLHERRSLSNDISNDICPRETTVPKDPPCFSVMDPPEWTVAVPSDPSKEYVNSMDAVVGRDIVLDLSSITGGVGHLKEEPVPDMPKSDNRGGASDSSNVSTRASEDASGRADHGANDGAYPTTIDAAKVAQSNYSNEDVDNKKYSHEQQAKIGSNDDPKAAEDPRVVDAKTKMLCPSVTSEAPERTSDEYSESFEVINQSSATRGDIHASSDRPDSLERTDNVNGPRPEKRLIDKLGPLSSAGSSDGYSDDDAYSESFC